MSETYDWDAERDAERDAWVKTCAETLTVAHHAKLVFGRCEIGGKERDGVPMFMLTIGGERGHGIGTWGLPMTPNELRAAYAEKAAMYGWGPL